MPLPPPRRAGLRAGRQVQVELFEIPFTGGPEIPCRKRIYAFPTALQRLALSDNTLAEFRAYQVT